MFRVFLPLKEAVVATFSEKRGLTFRKCVTEQDKIMQSFLESLQFYWYHSSVLALKK